MLPRAGTGPDPDARIRSIYLSLSGFQRSRRRVRTPGSLVFFPIERQYVNVNHADRPSATFHTHSLCGAVLDHIVLSFSSSVNLGRQIIRLNSVGPRLRYSPISISRPVGVHLTHPQGLMSDTSLATSTTTTPTWNNGHEQFSPTAGYDLPRPIHSPVQKPPGSRHTPNDAKPVRPF